MYIRGTGVLGVLAAVFLGLIILATLLLKAGYNVGLLLLGAFLIFMLILLVVLGEMGGGSISVRV